MPPIVMYKVFINPLSVIILLESAGVSINMELNSLIHVLEENPIVVSYRKYYLYENYLERTAAYKILLPDPLNLYQMA